MEQVDVVVIGAGTAGMHAFSRLKKAGLEVRLVDSGPLGTTCARVGCMPSKAVLHAAQRWDTLRGLMPAGLAQAKWLAQLPPGHVRPQQLWEQALGIRDELVAGNLRELERLAGAALLIGSARFLDARTLELHDGRQLQARAFILATGSEAVRPADLAAQLGDRLLTTEELFYLPQLPRSVAVMGLGAIGLEMGLALARLGVVTVGAGRSKVLAGLADPEVAQAAAQYFGQVLPLALGASVEVRALDGGVEFQAGGRRDRVDYVLAALGRRPRLGGLQLERSGLRLDEQQRPLWNAQTLQATGAPIFLAGDVTGQLPLMHEAAAEGGIAAESALRYLQPQRPLPTEPRSCPISIIFSDPDLATVGLGFAQLPRDALIASAKGSGNGRSKIMQAPGHLLRLYADRHSRRLLGASLLCAGGEHLAHQLAWAVQRGETVDSLRELPFYHPTVEEMIDNALKDLSRQLAD